MKETNVNTFNALLNKMKNGDADAFDRLYRCFAPKIVKYIVSKYHDIDFGYEVAHEFFHKMRKKPDEENVSYPVAWVEKICDNLAKNMIKAKQRETAVSDDKMAELETAVTFDDSKLDGIFGTLTKYVEKLDPRSREVLTMHDALGYSYSDIADALGESYGNVRQIHSRACKKLKELVTK